MTIEYRTMQQSNLKKSNSRVRSSFSSFIQGQHN